MVTVKLNIGQMAGLLSRDRAAARFSLLGILLLSLAALAGCASSRGGPIPYDVQNFGVPDAPRAAVPVGADYRVATGDKLSVTVYQVSDLSREYTVDLAGNIAVPLIGNVAAVGRTTAELDQDITQRLGQRYLRNPDVTVAVTQSTNNNVTVEGGVRRSGIFPLTGPTSLIQSVAMAGGIDPQAGNARRVAIFRQVQGQRMAAAFDLVSIRRGEMADPQVHPGDIVIVESNERRGLFQDLLSALPLFAIFRPF
jgi:polysaccharide biosynthesis/export protein